MQYLFKLRTLHLYQLYHCDLCCMYISLRSYHKDCFFEVEMEDKKSVACAKSNKQSYIVNLWCKPFRLRSSNRWSASQFDILEQVLCVYFLVFTIGLKVKFSVLNKFFSSLVNKYNMTTGNIKCLVSVTHIDQWYNCTLWFQ